MTQIVCRYRIYLEILSPTFLDFCRPDGNTVHTHPVAVVVEEDPLVPGWPAEAGGQPLDLVVGRVEAEPVAGPRLPPLVLTLQGVTDGLNGL